MLSTAPGVGRCRAPRGHSGCPPASLPLLGLSCSSQPGSPAAEPHAVQFSPPAEGRAAEDQTRSPPPAPSAVFLCGISKYRVVTGGKT